MKMHVGLVRAINLGSRNRVAMADLRALAAGLKLSDVQTLLQSGNVIFGSDGLTTAQLERSLENGAKKRLGLETEFFVRTAREWKTMIAENPFPMEARNDPARLVVLFLKTAPSREAESSLKRAIVGREVVGVAGRHAYVVYPDGMGRSRLTSALIEARLGTRSTARNWNTVMKLGAMLGVS
jgi:uncharacterized protein (DUF1697 family)